MSPLSLLQVIDSADGIDTRKRMQKLVFMLKAAGCELGADYVIHRYGPYSQDVARACDTLVQRGLLLEEREETGWGQQYSYCLTDEGREYLATTKAPHDLSPWREEIDDWIGQAMWPLEVASTVAFHLVKGDDIEDACTKAFDFKDVEVGSPVADAAREIAEKAVSFRLPAKRG